MKRPGLILIGIVLVMAALLFWFRPSAASTNDNAENKAIVFAHLINPSADCRSMGIGGWFAPDTAICRESDTQGRFGVSWCVGGGATRPACSPYKSETQPAPQQAKPAQAPAPVPPQTLVPR